MTTPRPILLAVTAGVLAAAAAGATATAVAGAATAPAQTFKCVQKNYSQTAGELKGFDFGVMLCTGPFGTGVQADNYTETAKRGGKILSKGSFKDYFDAGVVKGTWSLTGKFTSPTSGRFTGPVKITGGTGAYSAIHGSGKLTCSTGNAGKTDQCLLTVTETGY